MSREYHLANLHHEQKRLVVTSLMVEKCGILSKWPNTSGFEDQISLVAFFQCHSFVFGRVTPVNPTNHTSWIEVGVTVDVQ